MLMRSVLVANRGEIAVRVIRTLHRLGIQAVAVYSDADRGAAHVGLADTAVRLGPAPAAESYLSLPRLLEAVEDSGAEAVHPGYGFLAENADFARAVIGSGARWIGPPPEAIEAMGDKIRAKAMVAAAGVATVPGSGAPGMNDDELVAAALEVGLPVLIKPSAGGGGKGMHRVSEPAQLSAAIASARREAGSSFGDDTLLVERWVTRPRHIEVQIFADSFGAVVHLGERECSLQRRHQKVVEEAPSPLLDEATRGRLGTSAIEVARACGYIGAGTVEFIVSADRPDDYFFLEMNTRLQVEHPVTEEVTGWDLVEAQLRVAAGEPLPFLNLGSAKGPIGGPPGASGSPKDSIGSPSGHAIEARVYAEDPARGFLPSSGRVLAYHEPSGAGIRVDSSLARGVVVGTDYDPLLAKVIAWGADRQQARRRLIHALAGTTVLGVTTNIGFLQDLLDAPEVVDGKADTELVDGMLPLPVEAVEEAGKVAAMAAGALWLLEAEPAGTGYEVTGYEVTDSEVVDPWDLPGAWRVGGPGRIMLGYHVSGSPFQVVITGRATGATITVIPGLAGEPGVTVVDGAGAAVDGAGVAVDGAQVQVEGVLGAAGARTAGEFLLSVAGRTTTWTWAADGTDRWLGHAGRSWLVRPIRTDAGASPVAAASGGQVASPMPGTVLAVAVALGDLVIAGAPLVVVEAMKMEHTVTAPFDGTVGELMVSPGQAVALDEMLAVVKASSPPLAKASSPPLAKGPPTGEA